MGKWKIVPSVFTLYLTLTCTATTTTATTEVATAAPAGVTRVKITFRGITYANYQMNTRTRRPMGEGKVGRGKGKGFCSRLLERAFYLAARLTRTDACLDGLNAFIMPSTGKKWKERGEG